MTDPPHYVYTGRFQPFHTGHLTMLRASLERFDGPHLLALVWSGGDVESELVRSDPKHLPAANPLTVWEARQLVLMALAAEGLRDSVDLITVPRDDRRGERLRAFLPPGCVRCATTKDQAELRKLERWAAKGYAVRLLDLTGTTMTSATELKRALREGAPWRPHLHPATHDYFAAIDGPRRFAQAA